MSRSIPPFDPETLPVKAVDQDRSAFAAAAAVIFFSLGSTLYFLTQSFPLFLLFSGLAVFCLGSFVVLRTTCRTVEFGTDAVTFSDRALGRVERWTEPFHNYEAIELRSAGRRPSAGARGRLCHFVALLHGANPARSLLLYETPDDWQAEVFLEKCVRAFRLPGVIVELGGVRRPLEIEPPRRRGATAAADAGPALPHEGKRRGNRVAARFGREPERHGACTAKDRSKSVAGSSPSARVL